VCLVLPTHRTAPVTRTIHAPSVSHCQANFLLSPHAPPSPPLCWFGLNVQARLKAEKKAKKEKKASKKEKDPEKVRPLAAVVWTPPPHFPHVLASTVTSWCRVHVPPPLPSPPLPAPPPSHLRAWVVRGSRVEPPARRVAHSVHTFFHNRMRANPTPPHMLCVCVWGGGGTVRGWGGRCGTVEPEDAASIPSVRRWGNPSPTRLALFRHCTHTHAPRTPPFHAPAHPTTRQKSKKDKKRKEAEEEGSATEEPKKKKKKKAPDSDSSAEEDAAAPTTDAEESIADMCTRLDIRITPADVRCSSCLPLPCFGRGSHR
jgi:hypothetical protein